MKMTLIYWIEEIKFASYEIDDMPSFVVDEAEAKKKSALKNPALYEQEFRQFCANLALVRNLSLRFDGQTAIFE